jgi:arginase family enzyme
MAPLDHRPGRLETEDRPQPITDASALLPRLIVLGSRAGDIAIFGLDREISRRHGTTNNGAASFVQRQTLDLAGRYHPGGPVCHDLGILDDGSDTLMLPAAINVIAGIAGLGRRPALLGCDHTASLAGVVGCGHALGSPPVYVYLDAHFDLGRTSAPGDLHNGSFVGLMLAEGLIASAVNIGGRSLMTLPPGPLEANFTHIPVAGAGAGLDALIAGLAGLRTRPIYVSLDADILDPGFAPNVCCPEPDGMAPETLLALCRWIGGHCNVVGADLCEVMPALTSHAPERLLMRCLLALLGIMYG